MEYQPIFFFFFAECCWVSQIHRSVFVLTGDPWNSCLDLKSLRNRVKGRVLLGCILWCQVRTLNKADVTDCEAQTANAANRNYFIEHLCRTLEMLHRYSRMCPKAFLIQRIFADRTVQFGKIFFCPIFTSERVLCGYCVEVLAWDMYSAATNQVKT